MGRAAQARVPHAAPDRPPEKVLGRTLSNDRQCGCTANKPNYIFCAKFRDFPFWCLMLWKLSFKWPLTWAACWWWVLQGARHEEDGQPRRQHRLPAPDPGLRPRDGVQLRPEPHVRVISARWGHQGRRQGSQVHCAEKGGILKKPGPYCPLEKERWEDRLSSSSQNNLVNLTSGPMMGEGGPGPGPRSDSRRDISCSDVERTLKSLNGYHEDILEVSPPSWCWILSRVLFPLPLFCIYIYPLLSLCQLTYCRV